MTLDPVTAAFDFGGKLIDLISEAIPDPDKRAEIVAQIQRDTLEFSRLILSTKTTPRVDAFVKLLYAARDVAIPLFRPVLGALATAAAAWMAYKGVQVPEWMEALLAALFPAWVASRHANKTAEAAHKAEVEKIKVLAESRTRGADDGPTGVTDLLDQW